MTTTANAIYTNADGTIELVELDSIDTVYAIIATLTEDEAQAIHAGDGEYEVVGGRIHIGDGDSFVRVVAR